MAQFKLRYLAHDLDLPVGEFVIGRSEECQLAIDDVSVSRRHALLRVTEGGVTLVDLGSRNGIILNGARIDSERDLEPGDRFFIAKHELTFSTSQAGDSFRVRDHQKTLGPVAAMSSAKAPGRSGPPPLAPPIPPLGKSSRPVEAPTPPPMPNTGSVRPPPNREPFVREPSPPSKALARAAGLLTAIGPLVDKALAMGRADEAERLLAGPLGEIQSELRKGHSADPGALKLAGAFAIRLATVQERAHWVEWLLGVYGSARLMLPAPMVDELFLVAPKLKNLKAKTFEDYLDILTDVESLSANHRFLLQRLGTLTGRFSDSSHD